MKILRRRPSPGAAATCARLMLFCLICSVASPAAAVTITVHNADGFQEGFNDPKPVAPIGGNPGTTLGAQRLFIFQYAADAWGLRLGGNVPVVVKANFDPLGGTATSAILGNARPTTLERDFAGAPKSLTWYVASLENEITGTDRNNLIPGACDPGDFVGGKCAEIFARFNSDVDGPVVGGAVGFYYGLDGNHGSDIDFLSVVLHEIAHGLGLIDLINPDTGKITPNVDPNTDSCQTCTDAYTDNLEAPGFTPSTKLSKMTNAQRLDAIVDDGKLVWTGAAIRSASDSLAAGVRADGAVQIYAPTAFQLGSSVAHVDQVVLPNELMKPFLVDPPPHNLTITLALLKDIGWTLLDVPECGDPSDDRKITTADALLVLKGAVGSGDCPDHVCNVNFAGGVTTSDALLVLKYAVGQPVTLSCPLA